MAGALSAMLAPTAAASGDSCAQLSDACGGPSFECLQAMDGAAFLQVDLSIGDVPQEPNRAQAPAVQASSLAHGQATVSTRVETNSHLNPYKSQDTDGRICGLMAPLWRHAAGLLDVELSDDAANTDECSFIDRFYWSRHEEKGYSSNYVRAYKLGDFHLTYIPQWKCGNDNIRDNMHKLGVPEVSLNNGAAGTSVQAEAVENWQGVEDWQSSNEVFSIVRDPFSRFISGYNEIEYRIDSGHLCDAKHTGVGDDCTHALLDGTERFDDLELHTTNRPLEFIKDIVGYRLSPMLQYEHVFSMLGNLNAFEANFGKHISYIGRLEYLHDAWARMQEIGKLKFPEYDDDLGQHDSSTDLDMGDVMRDMLDSNDQATLALVCAVLLPDQICLHYDAKVDVATNCTSAGFFTPEDFDSLVANISDALCPHIREIQPF